MDAIWSLPFKSFAQELKNLSFGIARSLEKSENKDSSDFEQNRDRKDIIER